MQLIEILLEIIVKKMTMYTLKKGLSFPASLDMKYIHFFCNNETKKKAAI